VRSTGVGTGSWIGSSLGSWKTGSGMIRRQAQIMHIVTSYFDGQSLALRGVRNLLLTVEGEEIQLQDIA
jgi:hypothetical protein